MTSPPAFAIARQEGDLRGSVERVLGELGGLEGLGRSVFLKPNFTYPFPKRGVTTSRAMIVAVVEVLRDAGVRRLCLGEGEGGYNAFSMDETFAAFSLDELTERYGLENIIGNSAAMQPIFATVRQVAPTRATVLIEGESGTGKELVGRAIHHLSGRPKSKLVTVHCAALRSLNWTASSIWVPRSSAG